MLTFGVIAMGKEMPRKNPNAAADNIVTTGRIAFVFILTHSLTLSTVFFLRKLTLSTVKEELADVS